MFKKTIVVCAVVAMTTVSLSAPAFAKTRIKNLKVRQTVKISKSLILSGRDTKIANVENSNYESDKTEIIQDVKIDKSLILSGRDTKIANVENK